MVLSEFTLLTSSRMFRIFPTITLKAKVPASNNTGLTMTGIIEGISNLNSDLNFTRRGSSKWNIITAVIKQQNSQEVTSISLPNISTQEATKPH